MGILSWLLAALAAVLVSRAIAAGREPRNRFFPAAETFASIGGSLAAGLAATELDFGGLDELAIAPALFAFFIAAAAIAIVRIIRLRSVKAPRPVK